MKATVPIKKDKPYSKGHRDCAGASTGTEAQLSRGGRLKTKIAAI